MSLLSQADCVVLLAGSDETTIACLRPSAEVLAEFGLGVETVVVTDGNVNSAIFEGKCAVIVASPDGALPSAVAAATKLPVIRVPTGTAEQPALGLLRDDTGNLPGGAEGVAFATMAIGLAGAKNAALFVVAAMAVADERIGVQYAKYRASQTAAVLNHLALET